jgi:predicted molibdopterin-dependent oxidoreductase YjgC
MDWTNTETTEYADVVLPGSTYLETDGTRCNFEGRLVEFARAVEPPSGISGKEVLKALADEMGIGTGADLTREVKAVVADKLGPLTCFYWNTGETRISEYRERLVAAGAKAKAVSIQPPLTHGEKYKKEIREVGTERFRVRA